MTIGQKFSSGDFSCAAVTSGVPLHEMVRAARLAYEDNRGITQQELAELCHVTRETISAVENGRMPNPETLFQLASNLSLDIDVKLAGPSTLPHDADDDALYDLGRALRAGRRAAKLSLRQVSELTGLHYSQLSRIERGGASRSGVIEVVPNDKNAVKGGERLRFSHPTLARLAEAGGARVLGYRTQAML